MICTNFQNIMLKNTRRNGVLLTKRVGRWADIVGSSQGEARSVRKNRPIDLAGFESRFHCVVNNET